MVCLFQKVGIIQHVPLIGICTQGSSISFLGLIIHFIYHWISHSLNVLQLIYLLPNDLLFGFDNCQFLIFMNTAVISICVKMLIMVRVLSFGSFLKCPQPSGLDQAKLRRLKFFQLFSTAAGAQWLRPWSAAIRVYEQVKLEAELGLFSCTLIWDEDVPIVSLAIVLTLAWITFAHLPEISQYFLGSLFCPVNLFVYSFTNTKQSCFQ